MYDFDFLIVGCGLFGITIANKLSNKYRIMILEKRNHIGGNCYDYIDKDTNIMIHKYGPHIIHINDKKILNYISNYTDFNNYKHQVRTYYNDKIYEFPINLSTINSFYNINLRPYELDNFLKIESQKEHIQNPSNMEEFIINKIGKPLYIAFFKEYTKKQWGKDPKDLQVNIINRIPIRYNYDTNYYKKFFNGIPLLGFTNMFKNMLSSKNIKVILNAPQKEYKKYMSKSKYTIFTGPIDDFFDYKYGKLEYRSLIFKKELLNVFDFQGNSVINFPELKYEYTRICEPKHFYKEDSSLYYKNKTIIIKEIPCAVGEPYYPILDIKNNNKYEQYKNESIKYNNLLFGGRLGEYKYYDMEDTIKSALSLVEKFI